MVNRGTIIHSLVVPTQGDHTVHLPLTLEGVISLLNIRHPTKDDLEDYEELVLTSPASWDPYCADFAHNEINFDNENSYSHRHERKINGLSRQLNNTRHRIEVSAVLPDISNTLSDGMFYDDLIDTPNVELSDGKKEYISLKIEIS